MGLHNKAQEHRPEADEERRGGRRLLSRAIPEHRRRTRTERTGPALV